MTSPFGLEMKEYERAEQEDGDDCRLVWIDPFRFRYSWVKRCNRDFDNYTSLEVMMLESIIGIAEVWSLPAANRPLCTRGWSYSVPYS
jgi:hypothetical protein